MTNESDSLKGHDVLITGGLGFIGSNLAHRCLALGARVTVYDCLDANSGGNLYNIRDIRDDVEVAFHDILSFDFLAQYAAGKTIIFNCAASTSHPFSMREPWIDMDVNSRGVINLLEVVRRFNRDAMIVHVGTSTQLGRLHYQPADENHPEYPQDIYSANKSVSEKYVLIYAHAHGLQATVIRLANVYGPRAAIHSPEFTFNNYFIGLALQGKPVTVYGDGDQKRNVTYVDDVVTALIKAAQTDNTIGKALFAVGDEHYSIAEIAQATVRNMGTGEVSFIDWPASRGAVEIGDAVFSNAAITSVLNWSAEDTLTTGLQKTKAFYADKLEHYLG